MDKVETLREVGYGKGGQGAIRQWPERMAVVAVPMSYGGLLAGEEVGERHEVKG